MSKTSITNTRQSGSQLFSVTQIDLTATEIIIEDVIKFLCWVLKHSHRTAWCSVADVIMNNIYVTGTHSSLDTVRLIPSAIVL